MIEDKELEQLAEEKEAQAVQEIVVAEPQSTEVVVSQPSMMTEFSERMDEVKKNILVQASTEDNSFVNVIKENVKQAAVKLTEVEKGKAEFQEQQVDYEKEKLDTKQKKNINEQKTDAWETKQKRREFHYNGVKPIMQFVGIDTPMNLGFLYFLAVILTPLFLIAKFIKGTVGTLISGAQDADRGKAAKGFLWTMACLLSVLLLICLVYLFLKTQGIDILANIKN